MTPAAACTCWTEFYTPAIATEFDRWLDAGLPGMIHHPHARGVGYARITSDYEGIILGPAATGEPQICGTLYTPGSARLCPAHGCPPFFGVTSADLAALAQFRRAVNLNGVGFSLDLDSGGSPRYPASLREDCFPLFADQHGRIYTEPDKLSRRQVGITRGLHFYLFGRHGYATLPPPDLVKEIYHVR